MMKTSISTYSFHKLYGSGFTRFDAIDKTKEFGCDGVEFVLEGDAPDGYSMRDYALRLTEHAHKVGLEVPIYTTGANLFVPEPEKEVQRLIQHIDIASECGIPLLRHDVANTYYPGFEGTKTYHAVVEYVAPIIREISIYAQSKGVKTCSENHGRLMQDSNRIEELFNAVNHQNYGFLCDIGNFGGADENCAVAVSKLLELVVHVHAKDAFLKSGMNYNPGRGFNRTRGGDYRRATIFGHGDVPSFQILAAIKASGYDGYVSLEFEGIEDTMLAVGISIENLQRMIRDL